MLQNSWGLCPDLVLHSLTLPFNFHSFTFGKNILVLFHLFWAFLTTLLAQVGEGSSIFRGSLPGGFIKERASKELLIGLLVFNFVRNSTKACIYLLSSSEKWAKVSKWSEVVTTKSERVEAFAWNKRGKCCFLLYSSYVFLCIDRRVREPTITFTLKRRVVGERIQKDLHSTRRVLLKGRESTFYMSPFTF